MRLRSSLTSSGRGHFCFARKGTFLLCFDTRLVRKSSRYDPSSALWQRRYPGGIRRFCGLIPPPPGSLRSFKSDRRLVKVWRTPASNLIDAKWCQFLHCVAPTCYTGILLERKATFLGAVNVAIQTNIRRGEIVTDQECVRAQFRLQDAQGAITDGVPSLPVRRGCRHNIRAKWF